MASNAASLSQMCLLEQDRLREFLIRRVGRDAWEDIYHALWIRVQKVRDDPPVEDFRAFLFYLARIVALDHDRKEARRRRLHLEITKIVWGRDFMLPTDDVVLGRDQLCRLLIAARALPEPTRTIFALNRLESLTHREIAGRLGLSQTTIGKHLAKALKILSLAIDWETTEKFDVII